VAERSVDVPARRVAERTAELPAPRRRRPLRPGRIILHVVAVVLLLAITFPILWTVSMSLKTNADTLAIPPHLLPSPFRWANFTDVFEQVRFGRYLFNSFIVAVTVTTFALFFHSMSAYSLARLRYPGRNLIFIGILSTLMVPFTVIVVPLFVMVQKFGWTDTYAGLIIPLIFEAFGIFLLRQFYLSLPRELEEAALVDGANLVAVYWRIVLPLSRPILAALGIFYFLANWNNFLWPLVVAQSEDHWVVQVGIQQFSGNHSNAVELIAAASSVAALPMLVIFFVLQRRLIEGVKLSGLKG
jgi:multiple sugar transport system permease protein